MNFVLLTYEQVAERSGLRSARTVRKWVSSGQLPVVRLPSGAVRVDSRDFEKFVMDHKIPAVATPDPEKLLATLGLPARRSERPTARPASGNRRCGPVDETGGTTS